MPTDLSPRAEGRVGQHLEITFKLELVSNPGVCFPPGPRGCLLVLVLSPSGAVLPLLCGSSRPCLVLPSPCALPRGCLSPQAGPQLSLCQVPAWAPGCPACALPAWACGVCVSVLLSPPPSFGVFTWFLFFK